MRESLLAKTIQKILYIILGIVIGMILAYGLYLPPDGIKELLKIVLTPIVISFSALIALRQYMHNQEAHKKDLSRQAIATLVETRNKVTLILDDLNQYLPIRDSMAQKSRLTVEEINNAFNENFDEGGEPNNQEKRKVERQMLNFLNEYEHIGLSTKLDLIDKNTVIDLMGPNIYYVFYIFKDYIKHLRDSYGIRDVYSNFEFLANEVNKKFSLGDN